MLMRWLLGLQPKSSKSWRLNKAVRLVMVVMDRRLLYYFAPL